MNTWQTDYTFLRDSAGVINLSSRGRLCVIGPDRLRFLNGQVTNNVKELKPGEGCYAALVNAKGRVQSDLNIYCLPEELLLDFEPGLAAIVTQRLEKYVIADDVRVVDVSANFGMLTIQGLKSGDVIKAVGLTTPVKAFDWTKASDNEIYCMNHARGTAVGFDIFVPTGAMAEVHERLLRAAEKAGGGASSFEAIETIRIEAGIPRFGVDMDDSNLAPEAGIEARAISYSKGCYIGQEVISRIRAYGQVAKSLRGLRLQSELPSLPQRHDKLFRDGKEVGYVTSATRSPKFGATIALGYIRREHNAAGNVLQISSGNDEFSAVVCDLPFSSGSMN